MVRKVGRGDGGSCGDAVGAAGAAGARLVVVLLRLRLYQCFCRQVISRFYILLPLRILLLRARCSQVLALPAQKFLLQVFQQFSEESNSTSTPPARLLTEAGQAEVSFCFFGLAAGWRYYDTSLFERDFRLVASTFHGRSFVLCVPRTHCPRATA